MERISQKFKSLHGKGDTAFIPFSVAGFPNHEKSLEIFLKLAEGHVLGRVHPHRDLLHRAQIDLPLRAAERNRQGPGGNSRRASLSHRSAQRRKSARAGTSGASAGRGSMTLVGRFGA